jgi:hypothetical protein
MGEFWLEVGAAVIKVALYAVMAFGGIFLGMKLRISKNKKA